MNLDEAIKILKETFPEVTNITNVWLSYAKAHGLEQNSFEKMTLTKFGKAMKFLMGYKKK